METINNLAMATFQLVILFTVAKFISFVKFNLRDYFIHSWNYNSNHVFVLLLWK